MPKTTATTALEEIKHEYDLTDDELDAAALLTPDEWVADLEAERARSEALT